MKIQKKKMNPNCFYCQKDEELSELMINITELDISTLYLNKDQTHRGRCILAFNFHKRELFELTADELKAFSGDLVKAAQALQAAFEPNKINYSIYGDVVSHLHVHLVPKYKNGPEWGQAFENNPHQRKHLNINDYEKIIQLIKRWLIKCKK